MWRKICVLVFSAVFLQALTAALDWNITGSGARAAGMGNAFIGLADDATAINWNPGGLTVLEHFEASVVGAGIMDKETFKFSDSDGFTFEDPISYNHGNLSFLSMAYPMNIGDNKFVIAAAFQKQLDFFSEDAWDNGRESYEYSSTGGVYTANLGAGYQLLPYLSVGATANLWMGKSESDEVIGTDFDEETFYMENSNFSGFNLVIGTLFDMSSIKENIPLKIGAVIKTPFDLKFDYYEEWSYDDFNDDFYDAGYEYNSENTVELPFMFGIGASYRFGDYLTLSVDFEKRNYSKSKFKWEDEHGDSGENNLSENDEDVTQFRLGMEYLLVTDNLIVPLRLGLYNYPTLWNNYDNEYEYNSSTGEYENVLVTYEQLVGYGLSLGTGVIFESFALDVSYNFTTYTNEINDMYYGGMYDGYVTESSWENSKSAVNFSAIFYLDSFGK